MLTLGEKLFLLSFSPVSMFLVSPCGCVAFKPFLKDNYFQSLQNISCKWWNCIHPFDKKHVQSGFYPYKCILIVAMATWHIPAGGCVGH